MARKTSKSLSPRGRFWHKHVQQWQRSGAMQVQYCKEHQLSVPAFRWWRRKLANDLPALPIEKGRPGPGVLAYLLTSKYCNHLPLYRLEQIFARHGLQVSRTTQCDWVRDSADLLEAIALAMKRRILASGHLFTDDTYIPIQDKSRMQVREGYLWPYIDRANHVYFDYTLTRSREGPERMLKGYRGYVQADAFHGYDGLYGEGKATEVGCWGHARRKFDEAKQTDPLRANQMLAWIAQLYLIEGKAQDEHLDAEGVKALRQQFSKPILDDQIRPLLDAHNRCWVRTILDAYHTSLYCKQQPLLRFHVPTASSGLGCGVSGEKRPSP